MFGKKSDNKERKSWLELLRNRNQPLEVEEVHVSRRDFLQTGLGALSVIAAAELGLGGVLFLQARSLEGQYGGVITAGAVDEFAPGSVTQFAEGNFFLVRNEDGGFMAVHNRCPHLGCTVNWVAEKGKFYCPCHASSFDRNGDFQNQLVSRALDTFQVIFDDDMVKVDTANAQVRVHSSPEQISYKQ